MATTLEEISLFGAQKDYASAVFDRTVVLTEVCLFYSRWKANLTHKRYLRICSTRLQTQLQHTSKLAPSWRPWIWTQISWTWGQVFRQHVHSFLPVIWPDESKPSWIPDASKKQHMHNVVHPNLDLRQIATLEDTCLHEDPTKFLCLTDLPSMHLQCCR